MDTAEVERLRQRTAETRARMFPKRRRTYREMAKTMPLYRDDRIVDIDDIIDCNVGRVTSLKSKQGMDALMGSIARDREVATIIRHNKRKH
jgi:hypothetical protein